jgi:hypothetical protein
MHGHQNVKQYHISGGLRPTLHNDSPDSVYGSLCWSLGALKKLRKAAFSCVKSARPSVRPHGKTRPRLEGFS